MRIISNIIIITEQLLKSETNIRVYNTQNNSIEKEAIVTHQCGFAHELSDENFYCSVLCSLKREEKQLIISSCRNIIMLTTENVSCRRAMGNIKYSMP